MNRAHEAIRATLMAHWDPIGVRGQPAAADEYDSYAPGLARLLAAGATTADIAARILEIERREMGLPGDEAGAARAAQALTDLRTPR